MSLSLFASKTNDALRATSSTQRKAVRGKAVAAALHGVDFATPSTTPSANCKVGVRSLSASVLSATPLQTPKPSNCSAVTLRTLRRNPTRRNPTGNFTWYLWSDTTNEMACCVTTTVHQFGTLRFIEMPLFATASGYKRLGLGRLLNSALQAHCIECGAAFILVSSDVNAVDFWCSPSMGYAPITGVQKRRVEFLYKTECSQFEGSVLLTWSPPADAPLGSLDLVQQTLNRTPNIILEGDLKLSLP